MQNHMLIWEPSIFKSDLQCRGCSNMIPAKSIFFIAPGEIQYLLPNNAGYQAYSVRCASCGLKEYLNNEFGDQFKVAIENYNPNTSGYDTNLTRAVRQIVRQELQQILKEEAFDPHGPFSPAP